MLACDWFWKNYTSFILLPILSMLERRPSFFLKRILALPHGPLSGSPYKAYFSKKDINPMLDVWLANSASSSPTTTRSHCCSKAFAESDWGKDISNTQLCPSSPALVLEMECRQALHHPACPSLKFLHCPPCVKLTKANHALSSPGKNTHTEFSGRSQIHVTS